MASKRLAGFEIPLTDQQKKLLKKISGAEVNSLFVAARRPAEGAKMEFESDTPEDRELIRALYEGERAILPTLEMSSHNAPFEGIIAAAVVW